MCYVVRQKKVSAGQNVLKGMAKKVSAGQNVLWGKAKERKCRAECVTG